MQRGHTHLRDDLLAMLADSSSETVLEWSECIESGGLCDPDVRRLAGADGVELPLAPPLLRMADRYLCVCVRVILLGQKKTTVAASLTVAGRG